MSEGTIEDQLERIAREAKEEGDRKPEIAEHHFSLGEEAFERGDYREATWQFNTAFSNDPKKEYLRKKTDSLYELLKLEKKDKEEEVNIDGFINEFKAAIRSDPEYGKHHFTLAHAFGYNRMIRNAVEEVRKAIELEPEQGVYHYYLAFYLDSLGRVSEGREEYKKANFNNSSVGAIEVFGDLLSNIDDVNARGHIELGEALYNEGYIHLAILHYKEAQVWSRKGANPWPNRGGGDKLTHLRALYNMGIAFLCFKGKETYDTQIFLIGKDNVERTIYYLEKAKDFATSNNFSQEIREYIDSTLHQAKRYKRLGISDLEVNKRKKELYGRALEFKKMVLK